MQLNVEQKRIIESKPSGHTLIKGVAGSGKTTVAVNRIPLLLNHYCIEEDDFVLMATYNKSLSKYVEYIYESSKKELEVQSGFFDDNKDLKLDISTVDSLSVSYFNKYKKENNLSLSIASRNDIQQALIEAITIVGKKYPHIKMISPKLLSFINDEIVWIKGCNYMEIEEYQNVDRIGRVMKANSDGPQKLSKNSEKRNAIFEIMLNYNEILLKNNKVDFQDVLLIALKEAGKNPIKKYTHILIDESQDLSRVQIEFLKKLYNEKEYSSITFIADVAQSIYSQAWLVKNRSFSSIGYDMKGKSSSLSKNYRTTTQIAQAAFSLIQKDKELIEDSNFVKPSLIDRQGQYPIYRSFNNKEKEGAFVCNLIKSNLIKSYNYKDIVIIARLSNQLKEMRTYLEKNNIPCEIFNGKDDFNFGKECVKLVTMHSIKGLEFKVVIMIGVNSKVMPFKTYAKEIEDDETIESRERKLFYVGMTRATEKLFITSEGVPSKFIKDIDYKYLRIKSECEVRRISQIPIESYVLSHKIKDIYSEEEKVRQWFLRELIETYKYPLDLINIEEKVFIGSTYGFVDIAVSVDKNKGPYILIETKQWGKGIKDGLGQIKSYMANCPSAKFGVVSDGNEIIIINNKLEEIVDIPKFTSSMISSSLETIEYINLKWNTTHELIKDSSNPKELYIEENGVEIKAEEIREIPIFNEIAAGSPIPINSSFEGNYYLPQQWVGKTEDIFILKVRGESMKNKNILNGDYVLIKRQSSCNIGEIVAVDVEGEATLKTYKTMGGKVLLVPENDEYEPIMLEEGQLSIIGVVIGIIKNSNKN